jgi:hypothetical protein
MSNRREFITLLGGAPTGSPMAGNTIGNLQERSDRNYPPLARFRA